MMSKFSTKATANCLSSMRCASLFEACSPVLLICLFLFGMLLLASWITLLVSPLSNVSYQADSISNMCCTYDAQRYS